MAIIAHLMSTSWTVSVCLMIQLCYEVKYQQQILVTAEVRMNMILFHFLKIQLIYILSIM